MRLWGSNPELPGGSQVHLPSGLRGQSSDVDRVSSVAGGGAHTGSGLASGTSIHALAAFSALIGRSSPTPLTLSNCVPKPPSGLLE